MASLPQSAVSSLEWSTEAMALVAQAKVLSGNKLERLVVRLQCLTGRSKDKCWRYVIQYGIKEAVDHRRWTEGEIDVVREELVKHSIEEVAKKVNRTPKAIRSLLQRHGLSVREDPVRQVLDREPLNRPACSEDRDSFLDQARLAPSHGRPPR